MRIVALGDRDPQFLTHREVDAALPLFGGAWTATDSAEAHALDDAAGVWLLPGTPYRDDDAAYAAVAHCLDTGTPFLGTCGGFQYGRRAVPRVPLLRPRLGRALRRRGPAGRRGRQRGRRRRARGGDRAAAPPVLRRHGVPAAGRRERDGDAARAARGVPGRGAWRVMA